MLKVAKQVINSMWIALSLHGFMLFKNLPRYLCNNSNGYIVSFHIRDHVYNERSVKQLPASDSGYYCPFSHPSVRDTALDIYPLPPERHDIISSFLGRQRRSVQLKSLYVSHNGQILSATNEKPLIRVDATIHVSDYALQVVS